MALICGVIQALFIEPCSFSFNLYVFSFPDSTHGLDLFSGACRNKLHISEVPCDSRIAPYKGSTRFYSKVHRKVCAMKNLISGNKRLLSNIPYRGRDDRAV